MKMTLIPFAFPTIADADCAPCKPNAIIGGGRLPLIWKTALLLGALACGACNSGPSPRAGAGGLRIISAVYSGHGGKTDVTALIAKEVRPSSDVIFASPKWLGVDPANGWKKELAITYEIGGHRATLTTREGGAVSYEILLARAGLAPAPTAPASTGEPRILAAYFGTGGTFADVTARVAELIQTEPGGFGTTGDVLGADPFPNLRKEFMVVYEYGGQRHAFTTYDGGPCGREILARNAAHGDLPSDPPGE
jgi:hypothetical protein